MWVAEIKTYSAEVASNSKGNYTEFPLPRLGMCYNQGRGHTRPRRNQKVQPWTLKGHDLAKAETLKARLPQGRDVLRVTAVWGNTDPEKSGPYGTIARP